jgi:hypothetical protein
LLGIDLGVLRNPFGFDLGIANDVLGIPIRVLRFSAEDELHDHEGYDRS